HTHEEHDPSTLRAKRGRYDRRNPQNLRPRTIGWNRAWRRPGYCAGMRRPFLLILVAACLWPASAAAGPLGLSDCRQAEGVYQCSGLVTTWDGVPLDTTVSLPTAASK